LKFFQKKKDPITLKYNDKINTIDDLQETIAYFFNQGSAAERFIADEDLFNNLILASIEAKNKHYFIGGNAALMGQRLATEGVTVLLAGAIGHRLQPLLHENIKPINVQEKDEVHLILEYPKDATWGNLESPRANRFIAVHDITNSRVTSLENFHHELYNFDAQAVVIAGLHLLEGQSKEYRTQRLRDVVTKLDKIKRDIPVHLELASVGDESYLSELGFKLLAEVDSIGLNEQELYYLYKSLGGTELQNNQFTNPTPYNVQQVIEFIFNIATPKNNQRGLTRIHFHYLTYHVIAVRRNDQYNYIWNLEKAKIGVAAGSFAASVQACSADVTQMDLLFPATFDINQSTLNIDSTVNWNFSGINYFLSPVLVCKKPTKTVGLGDTISSIGLLYSF